jgi:hypothetical protein
MGLLGSMAGDDGCQFTVGADMALVQGAARCLGEAQRQLERVIEVVGAQCGRENPELVHHPDQAAAGSRRENSSRHLGHFALDQVRVNVVGGQHVSDRRGQSGQQRPGGSQGDDQRQQG